MTISSIANSFKSKKDYITVGISVFALTISGISFYYSNLRIEDNLQAKIIKVHIIHGAVNDSTDTSAIQVAFVNAGNRQATVINTLFNFSIKVDGRDSLPSGGDLFDNRNLFPMILQPHEVRLVELKLSFKTNGEIALHTWFGENDNPNYDKKILFSRGRLKIEYLSLDSKGNFYSAETPDFRANIYRDDSTSKWHSGDEAPPVSLGLRFGDHSLQNWIYESTFLFSKKMAD